MRKEEPSMNLRNILLFLLIVATTGCTYIRYKDFTWISTKKVDIRIETSGEDINGEISTNPDSQWKVIQSIVDKATVPK